MFGIPQLQMLKQSLGAGLFLQITPQMFEFFNNLYFIAWKADQDLQYIRKNLFKISIEAFMTFDFSNEVSKPMKNDPSFSKNSSSDNDFPSLNDFPSEDMDEKDKYEQVNYHVKYYEGSLNSLFKNQISPEEFVSFVEKLFQRPSSPNLAEDLKKELQKCSISVIDAPFL